MRKKILQIIFLLLPVAVLGACTEVELASHVAKQAIPTSQSQGTFKVGSPYKVKGRTYRPTETYSYEETGIASWYGTDFNGKKTANGETFNMYELTAAHKTLQMPSLVRVTNLENGKSIVVRVNDRGPFSRGRIIDLSMRSAELLGFKNQGTAKVKLQLLADESRRIANAAKAGQDTRGTEVAMNERGYQPISTHRTVTPPQEERAPLTRPASTPQVAQNAAVPPVERADIQTASVPGHVSEGRFYPDPVVKNMPVHPSNIYVQAGSFGNAANAERLAYNLKDVGNVQIQPALVNGQNFYRVRIGPLKDVPAADTMLRELETIGQSQAIVVVD